LNPSVVLSFGPNQIGALSPSAVSGFTEQQMIYLSGCDGFTVEQFGHLSLNAFYGISVGCVELTSAEVWEVVNASYIAELQPYSCSGFRRRHIPFLAFSAGGFSTSQLNYLTTYASTCKGFTSEFIGNISLESIQGITLECISVSPPTSWQFVTEETLGALTNPQVASFTSDHFQSIPSNSFRGFSASQVRP